MKYIVYLTYYSTTGKIVDDKLESEIKLLTQKFKGEELGSSGGLGGRDIDIYFGVKKNAQDFIWEALAYHKGIVIDSVWITESVDFDKEEEKNE